MHIYLPIAEMSVNIFRFSGMGGAVGFLSGLFGVGGGFLMTPLLIFIGVPPPVAVGTEATKLSRVLFQAFWHTGDVPTSILKWVLFSSWRFCGSSSALYCSNISKPRSIRSCDKAVLRNLFRHHWFSNALGELKNYNSI